MFTSRKNTTAATAAGDNPGSGGKIMRGRRRATDARSPYAQPTTPASSSSAASESPSNNSSRLLGLISPASKMITGAAKMISTVFFPDTPPTSPSSDDESDDDDISSQEDDISVQNGARLEENSSAGKNLQLNIRKNEVKLAIEHLLMQVTFSRDECDKLVKIIESRVVELPATNIPDICNSAIMEARKWVEEKKTESHSQFDKNQVTDEEQGSPVLMAKSYMKSRPPWSSPTAGHVGFKLTSPTGMYPSKEDTHALSPSKDLKRSSHAIDLGNTTDGSKRVRFRAAEDTSHSLSAHDSSQRFDRASVEAEIGDVEMGGRTDHSNSMPTTEPVKQSAIGDHDQDFVDAQTTLEGGLTDHASVISDLKLTEGTSPPFQSISNGAPQVNGTDDLSSQPGGLQVQTESFDVNGNSEQSTEDNERSATVNNDNVVQEMEAQASAKDNIRPISKFALAEGNLIVNDDQQDSAEIQNPNSPVLAHWRDIHENPDSDCLDNLMDRSHEKHEVTTVPFRRSKGGSVADNKHRHDVEELDPLSQKDHAKPKEINGTREGLSSASSLSGRENAESCMKPGKDQEKDTIKSIDGNLEGSCELLSEASVEVPTNEEFSNVASGSHNSSTRFSKEISQAETPSVSSPNTRKRSSARIEKLAAKKAGTYTNRSRGRGK